MKTEVGQKETKDKLKKGWENTKQWGDQKKDYLE